MEYQAAPQQGREEYIPTWGSPELTVEKAKELAAKIVSGKMNWYLFKCGDSTGLSAGKNTFKIEESESGIGQGTATSTKIIRDNLEKGLFTPGVAKVAEMILNEIDRQ